MKRLLLALTIGALLLGLAPTAEAGTVRDHAIIQTLPIDTVVASDDLDADGLLDVLTRTAAGYRVYYGSAGGALLPGPQVLSVPDLQLSFDMNGDRSLDFFVASEYSCGSRGPIRAVMSAGRRSYSAPTVFTDLPGSTFCPYVVDVDGDGQTDVVVDSATDQTVTRLSDRKRFPRTDANKFGHPKGATVVSMEKPTVAGMLNLASAQGMTFQVKVPTDQPRAEYSSPIPGTDLYRPDGTARPVFLYRQESEFGSPKPTTTFWVRQLSVATDMKWAWGQPHKLLTLPGIRLSMSDCIVGWSLVQGRYYKYLTSCDSEGRPKYRSSSGSPTGYDSYVLDLETGAATLYGFSEESNDMWLLAVNPGVLVVASFSQKGQLFYVLKANAPALKSIKCRKGSVTKVVKAPAPICPKGWKKV